MTTEILGLDELSSSQSGKEITHNTALRQIEGRLVRALSMTLTVAPSTPANGDVYIVAAGATGTWAGKDNNIAHFFGGSWKYYAPIHGNSLWVCADDRRYLFDGTNWIVETGAVLPDGDYGDVIVSGGGLVMSLDINGAAAKTAPVDADCVALMDSAASNVLKKLNWANIKATLKTYFDTLYAPQTQPFDLTCWYPGQPTTGATVLAVPVARPISWPADFAGAYAKSTVAALTGAVFNVQVEGTTIGTITFAASATSATFATTSHTAKSASAGNVVSIVVSGTPDANLSDLKIVIPGTR